ERQPRQLGDTIKPPTSHLSWKPIETIIEDNPQRNLIFLMIYSNIPVLLICRFNPKMKCTTLIIFCEMITGSLYISLST
ncbi:hypothetical protein ACJBV1_11185, partial [Streptococcus suis]